MIQIRCHNNGVVREFAPGLTLQEIYDGLALDMPYGAVSARVNNKVEGLAFRVYNSKDVEFLDITSDSGMRTYVRTLFFVLTKAVSELYPEGEIIIEHPVSKGYFCNLRIGLMSYFFTGFSILPYCSLSLSMVKLSFRSLSSRKV